MKSLFYHLSVGLPSITLKGIVTLEMPTDSVLKNVL